MSKAKSTCSYNSVQYMLLCGKCNLLWDHGEGLSRWYLKVQGGRQRKACMSWSPQWEGEKSWLIEGKREENRRKGLCESLEAGHIRRTREMGKYLSKTWGWEEWVMTGVKVGLQERGHWVLSVALRGSVPRSTMGPAYCHLWGWTWSCWYFRKFTYCSGNRVEKWSLETLWN